ncbi:hypothetical protein GN244_ATG09701 [Phytophthora infestans]|uniref:Transmembrane protein n=1 Tax=Phytophthora infestans TaxID=4787 RepID=A0A833WUS2_PHYIN|nr:hypothetical protein GN244_ATG09701 [Phytophthora infestans]
MSGMTFTMTEKYVAAIFTHALFGFMSVHFVLVALWLVVVQHARAPLFGQWDEWIVVADYEEQKGFQTVSRMLVAAFHISRLLFDACGLSVGVIRNEIQETWTTCEMAVQLLADVIGLAFLTLLLDDNGQIDIGTDDFIREPLLSNV